MKAGYGENVLGRLIYLNITRQKLELKKLYRMYQKQTSI